MAVRGLFEYVEVVASLGLPQGVMDKLKVCCLVLCECCLFSVYVLFSAMCVRACFCFLVCVNTYMKETQHTSATHGC